MQKSNSVCHIEKQSFRPALGLCCVCVSYSQYLLLPLAIVSECAGKLTAYLCRAARDQQGLPMDKLYDGNGLVPIDCCVLISRFTNI